MSARVDLDAQAGATLPFTPSEAAAEAQLVAFDPDDRYSGPSLPGDHPRWMRDTLSISQRARALLVKVKPVVIRVVTYWEHRVRSILVAGGTLSVDRSGSYRFD